jgi:hypothetical protein
MRRTILLLAAALVFAASSANSQALLPSSFEGWTAASDGSPSSLDYLPAGASEQMIEYGTVEAERRVYTRGPDQLTVTLYRIKDPSGAYGAYSFLRTPDMASARLTEHSSLSRTRALALVGNLIVDVTGKELPSHQADLRALASGVAPHSDQSLYPTLWRHLPTEGIVPRSDRYVLGPATLHQLLPLATGDWVGFSNGAEAELARYRARGQEVTLLIADFPTPQGAEKQMQEWARLFNLNGEIPNDPRPVVFIHRSMTLLGLVANTRSQEVADSLLSKLQSGIELTWNEPGFSLTDPSVGRMVVGTIIGTGILCLFALVAGLAFGGVRVLVKRFVPRAVFDRSSTMQILQLGLSSKPIESKDFYWR